MLSDGKLKLNVEDLSLDDSFEIRNVKISRRKLNAREISTKLNLYKVEKVPVSVSEIARSLGIDKKELYHHFPEDCKALAKRCREETIRVKQNRFKEMESVIKEAVMYLCSQGIYPSRRKVEEYTGRNGLLRERRLFNVLGEELGGTNHIF